MNATSIIVIAVAAVVVLGMISFVTLARRSDVRGAGALSAETRQRDRAARAARPVEAPSRNAAEAEAEGVVARTGTTLVRREPAPLAPWVPPDPEAIGVSRRMFFNRATIALMTAGIATFAAASFVAFLWPFKTGGFGGKVADRQARRHQGGHHRRQWLLLRARGPHLGHGLSARRDPEGRGGLLRADPPRHARGHRRALPEVPAPRLPRAELRQQPMVRMPVPRLAVQPRRREEGRPRTARHGPLPGHRRRQRRRHGRHRHRRQRPGRSAPTPPARRPRGPTASGSRSTDAGTCNDVDRVGPPRDHGGGLDRLRRAQRRRRRAASSARRSSWRPTASRTSTTRSSRVGGSSSLQFFSLIMLVIIVIGLPLYWILEPSRMAGATEGPGEAVRRLGIAAVRADRHDPDCVQLRRLPRRDEGRRRRRPVQHHRRPHR